MLLRVDGALAFLPAATVQSIVALPAITPVPGRHEPLLGIAQVGNGVIPVLGLGALGASRGSLVVTKHAGEPVGLAGIEKRELSVLSGGERSVRVDPAGKPSVSHFKVLERRGGHSFCEVRIETGRTHQIRVHAAHLGHPVAGDDKYGDEEANKRLAQQVGLKRLFLHAASIEFALEKGARPYLINAPLSEDLSAVLDRLT